MYTYVRCTKLSDIGGRSAYITNKTGRHKEEDVLCVGGPTSDWKPYQTYEREHQRSSEPNNEGRELIVAIPNAWGNALLKPLLKSRVDSLAQKLIGKDTDYQFAVHWNRSHSNLHAHIIFSERQKCPQTNAKGSTIDLYDRDIYLTRDGKIARTKADRALDAQGNVKPPIHRKGEPKNQEFTLKDKKYKSKQWIEDVKKTVSRTFWLEPDKKHVTNYLHTYHEGKAPQPAAANNSRNEVIRSINQLLDDRKKEGYIPKKVGDKVYNELYKRVFGIVDDGTDLEDWINKNVFLNTAKVQQRERKKEERAERVADREAAEQARNAEIAVNNAYNATIALFNSRISRDIERNNLTYDALEVLTGTQFGTYNSKEYPKLEKKYQKALKEVSNIGKSADLIRKLEPYFSKILQNNRVTFFEAPYSTAKTLLNDINRTNAYKTTFDLPPSPAEREEHKRAKEARLRAERQAYAELHRQERQRKEQQKREQSTQKTSIERSEPEPKTENKRKIDTWSR